MTSLIFSRSSIVVSFRSSRDNERFPWTRNMSAFKYDQQQAPTQLLHVTSHSPYVTVSVAHGCLPHSHKSKNTSVVMLVWEPAVAWSRLRDDPRADRTNWHAQLQCSSTTWTGKASAIFHTLWTAQNIICVALKAGHFSASLTFIVQPIVLE